MRAALSLLMVAAGCSATADEAATATAPILKGTATAGDPAVIALVPRALHCGAGRPVAFCSGALIAPRVVLTAAHCVVDRRAGELRVFFGADVASGGSLVDVVETRVHPRFDRATGGFDVAVVRLAAASAVPPLATAALDGSASGKTVRVVGFGADETKASGVKRTGTSTVSSVDDAILRYVPGPAMTCGGDSGGPVLLDERIVAVTRSGDAACVEAGSAIRVDAVADLLTPFIEASASAPAPPVHDPARDTCGSSCTTDAECPLAMRCLNERSAGYRCGLPTLGSGRFGARCGADAECGEGGCVFVDDGDCRCFSPCAVAPQNAGELGGGCGVSRAGSSGALAMLGLIVLLLIGRSVSEPRPFRN